METNWPLLITDWVEMIHRKKGDRYRNFNNIEIREFHDIYKFKKPENYKFLSIKSMWYNYTNEHGETRITWIRWNKSRYIQSTIIWTTNFMQVVHTSALGCRELAPWPQDGYNSMYFLRTNISKWENFIWTKVLG